LIVARWLTFLFVMSAIGLFVFRLAIARPVVRLVDGTSLRNVSVAFVIACALALVMTPAYLLLSTAQFALRSWYDVGALFPLIRDSSFGRGYVDLELTFALFTGAALVALWLDRPERERRSIVELLSIAGALLAAGAVVFVPGLAGHAAQASPRALALFLDATHVATGSIWIGGLIGLLVLGLSLSRGHRTAGFVAVVPRFSIVAFVSVNLLIASGVGRTVVELPTVSSLWQTSYGRTILVKVGLLGATMLIAAVNLLRTTPHLVASRERPEFGAPAAALLRRLVSVEVVIVAAVIVAAAVLSSLAPPSKALAALGEVSAHVGPGPVTSVVERNGYTLQVRVTPNRAAQQNEFSLALNRDGRPVTGANVTATFAMLDMEMGQQAYDLKESDPGVYKHAAPALVMVGHWGITFDVEPPGGQPFDATVIDRANG
jgi:copper transport protein